MSTPEHTIHAFPGGLHLPDNKSQSNQTPIVELPVPKQLVVPLQQHIGTACEPLVEVGELVQRGQVIARSKEYISAPIHAPSSGTVTEIGDHPVPHPSGLSAPCVVIETDGRDAWTDELPDAMPDYREHSPTELRERIRRAGIVGLGGAAFPTSVKTNPGPDKQIETLILNGAECEPYITCDDRLMREQPERVLDGAKILMHACQAKACVIGIEDNKPEAIAALNTAIEANDETAIRVVSLPTLYPSGGEKQLIYLVTGQEVPSRGLPADLGVLCQNVGTAAAAADAVLHSKPLLSRIVTVTGEGIATPGNFLVRIGTPLADVIAAAGGYTDTATRLIVGGPMMGFSVEHDQLPLTKSINCLLVASAAEAPPAPAARPCIRCGKCAEVCPAQLLPQQLYWYARSKDLDKTQDYHLFDCIECGCCAHVCPSSIPLVQYYRYAKTEIWMQERDKLKSDLARRRHDARQARLERIEQERKARLRRKKEALEKKKKDQDDPKKAAIAAAMERVAAKKAARAREQESGS